MSKHLTGAALLAALALASCEETAISIDAGGTVDAGSTVDAASTTRVVGNCVADYNLCPSHMCLPQGDGIYHCACADVPAGQTCEPCPPGYRYHGKYYSCEPTCAVVAPKCSPGQSCGDLFGVATCMPSDGGAADGPPARAAKCTCNGGCGAGEICLQNQPGGVTPGGVQCGAFQGLAECRTRCGPSRSCSATRPHCLTIPILSGCCSDAIASQQLCCANADASSVVNCL